MLLLPSSLFHFLQLSLCFNSKNKEAKGYRHKGAKTVAYDAAKENELDVFERPICLVDDDLCPHHNAPSKHISVLQTKKEMKIHIVFDRGIGPCLTVATPSMGQEYQFACGQD
ncbi:hypothetical protein ACJX0J_034160 [Zea mays]